MLASIWNAKEKKLFRAGMNRWFRREYFVDKSPNAVINQKISLGPLFVDIFLSFHECTWLADCRLTFKPMFYRRYVDDCF